MLTLVAGTRSEVESEIKKSRFLGHLQPVRSVAEAREVIGEARRRYPDARHHCSAYVLESEGATPQTHFSDDGEPAGTAGAPMLEVLLGHDLVNVVAVVTRYFGGTLLGTGGLVRAYSGSTQDAVKAARLARIEVLPSYVVLLEPDIAGRVESEIRRRNWTVEGTTWTNYAEITFTVPPGEEGEVEPLISSLTRGVAQARRGSDRRVEVPL